MKYYGTQARYSGGDLTSAENGYVGGVGFILFAILSVGSMIILLTDPAYGEFHVKNLCFLNFLVFAGCCLFNIYFLKLNILSLPQIYLVVTFMYTSGLLTLHAFGLADLIFLVRWYNDYYASIAIKTIMMAVFTFEAGLCVATFYAHKGAVDEKAGLEYEYSETLFKLGMVCFVFAILVIALTTVTGSGFSTMFKYGYKDFKLGIKNTDVRFFLTALSWLLPASLIIMAAGIKSTRQTIICYIFSAIAMGLFFIAGDRGGAFSFLLALVFTLRLIGKKFSYAKIFAGAVLVLLLVPVVKDLRHQPISQIVSQGIELRLEESPFYRAFAETGSSFQTLLGTVMIVPEIENYRYGTTYLFSLSKLVPNLGKWKPYYRESLTSWITSYMNPGEYGGLGFLQIAEFYVQFGILGIAAGFFVTAFFLTKWHQRCETGLSDRRWVAINGCLLCFLLVWIRNDIYNFIRPAVWSVALILVWSYFANKGGARREL